MEKYCTKKELNQIKNWDNTQIKAKWKNKT